MLNSSLFKKSFVLLLVIGILDYFANTFYLYWTVWWFDNLMHFISGICIAMFTIVIWQNFLDKSLSYKKAVGLSLFLALIIGIIWEDFELFFGIHKASDGKIYFLDTFSDIIMDLSGAIVGSIYGYGLLFKK